MCGPPTSRCSSSPVATTRDCDKRLPASRSSTAIGVGILVAGSFFDGQARCAMWAAALLFDMAGPLFIDTSGWRLVAGHFAERHGLIMIVALGESIVAIGVGAEAGVDGGVIVAAILGIAVACAFWWTYFDVAALMAARRLAEIESLKERNALARDAFSYLHLPMVAAIVLVALGMKSTLAHVGDPLSWRDGHRARRGRRAVPARSRRLQAAQPRLVQRPAASSPRSSSSPSSRSRTRSTRWSRSPSWASCCGA